MSSGRPNADAITLALDRYNCVTHEPCSEIVNITIGQGNMIGTACLPTAAT
jgi:hypothetical protein